MAGSDPFPVSVSQLHFPSSELQNTSQLLSSLRRSTLSIPNRLRSIETDARFVQQVAEHYNLPLVANERCGSWYIPSDRKVGSAYFKSTDGHAGQWDFSLRRLNLQIFDIVCPHKGCVIVDSTRRGKSLPDALSKTVPIWSAVWNRALFPESTAYHNVQFPPDYLGESEESQIEARIGGFIASLKTLNLDLPQLKSRLGSPIRLAWATREYMWPDYPQERDFNVIVLCSASKRVHGAEMSEGGYIQGAGDDSEAWAHGLTPNLFWENKDSLFSTDEEDLPGLIERLIDERCRKEGFSAEDAILVKPTTNLYIRTDRKDGGGASNSGFDRTINCNRQPDPDAGPKTLDLGCPSGKLGSRHLRKVLDQVEQFVSSNLGRDSSRSLVVTCDSGKDLSVGIILMILCLFYDDEGRYKTTRTEEPITKEFIRQRLAWITVSKHDINPSRATLQSINAHLMRDPFS